jgi:hypothetical protein
MKKSSTGIVNAVGTEKDVGRNARETGDEFDLFKIEVSHLPCFAQDDWARKVGRNTRHFAESQPAGWLNPQVNP